MASQSERMCFISPQNQKKPNLRDWAIVDVSSLSGFGSKTFKNKESVCVNKAARGCGHVILMRE